MDKVTKADKARAARYRRPMLQTLGYAAIQDELETISEECGEVTYFIEDGGAESLIDALDGDEEEAWEFRMAFSDLTAKADQLWEALSELEDYDDFDDCTVAILGNIYNVLGYDTLEEDYFSLSRYEQGLAATEAGKRIMRRTKAEMISAMGQCWGIVLAFCDLREKFFGLKATLDILRGQNRTMLEAVRNVERQYEAAENVSFCGWDPAAKKYEQLLMLLPERMWLE